MSDAVFFQCLREGMFDGDNSVKDARTTVWKEWVLKDTGDCLDHPPAECIIQHKYG